MDHPGLTEETEEMIGGDIAAQELRTMQAAWRALERGWDLAPAERRSLLPEGGEDDAAPPRGTETRMRILIEIGYRIAIPDELLDDWLRTASPTLHWLTPLEAMSGSMADLRGFRRLVEAGFAS